MPFGRVYAPTELRPFDVMVTWQVVAGQTEPQAIAIASNIAVAKFWGKQRETKKVKKSTGKETLKRKEKEKLTTREWQKKFDEWKGRLKRRGWTFTKLRTRIRALKKQGKDYAEVKRALRVVTKT